MSASLGSQTELVLDAAGVNTSSPNSKDEVQIQNTVDVVEDSMKDTASAYRGGAVQSPQSAIQAEEEDLYDASPHAKNSLEKRKASAAQPVIGNQQRKERATDESVKNVNDFARDKRTKDNLAMQNPVDDLLKNGATVHQSLGVTGRNRTNEQFRDEPKAKYHPNHPAASLVSGETHNSHRIEIDVGGHATSSTQQAKSNKPAQELSVRDVDRAPLAKKSKYKASRTPAVGALAALRSRHNVQDLNQTAQSGAKRQVPAPPPKATNSASGSSARPNNVAPQMDTSQHSQYVEKDVTMDANNSPLQVTNKSAPIEALNPKIRSEADTRPIPGKLRSRRNNAAGQIPKLASNSMKQPTGDPDTSDDPIGKASNIVADRTSRASWKDAAHGSKGTLKRPLKAMERDSANQDTTLDIPDSPVAQDKARPSNKARTEPRSLEKNIAKSTPKQRTPARKGKGSNNALASAASQRPRRGPPQKRGDQTLSMDIPQTSVRTRKMAKNDAATNNKVPQQPTTADNAMAPKTITSKEKDGVSISRGVESVKDFGRSVMNFEDDANDNVQTVTPTNNPVAAKASIVPVENSTTEEQARAVQKDPHKRARHTKEAPGASQLNAIELSDRQETSSSLSSSIQDEHVPPDDDGFVLNRSGAVVDPKTPSAYSSSPSRSNRIAATPPSGHVYDSAKQRPTIISFSKSGPLNQGLMSAKTDDFGGADCTLAGLDVNTVSYGSIAGGTVEKQRKSGPSSLTLRMKSLGANGLATHNNVAMHVGDALDAFTTKPKLRKAYPDNGSESHATQADTSTQSNPSLSLPTDDEGFVHVNDFEEATFVTQDTIPLTDLPGKPGMDLTKSLEITQPSGSMPSLSQKLHRAPTVPAMLTRQDNTLMDQSVNNVSDDIPLKRRLDAAEAEQPVKKVARHGYSSEAKLSQQSDRELHDDSVQDSVQKKPAGEQTLRKPRKPKRVMSHGSQTVDMHGSPVPSDMIVPGKSTVLETFTQHAHLSSEPSFELRLPGDIANDPGRGPIDLNSLPRKSERLSINNKRLPAAPHEESQMTTGFNKADAKGPLVQHMDGSQPLDPFNSSGEGQKRSLQTGTSVTFLEELRKTTVESNTKRTAASRFPEEIEDPDKTLVEAEPNKSSRTLSQNRSSSSASSSDTSSYTSESSGCQHDIGVWRNALQPYQLSLFDELVAVSHRLVQNLKEREIAAAEIVEDYRSRGLRLVEQMELNHAKRIQVLTESLKDRRNNLRKELIECGKNLKACTASFESVKWDDFGRDSNSGRVEESLQKIMEEFC